MFRSLEVISVNTEITPTPRGAVFRRADGVYVIGRRSEQTKPVDPPMTSINDERRTYRYFGVYGSRIKGRPRVIKETRTKPSERTSANGLQHPAAWAGNYATWESHGPHWSRPIEKTTIQLTPTCYKAQDSASWEQMVRKGLLSND